jgi:hypothetical protein
MRKNPFLIKTFPIFDLCQNRKCPTLTITYLMISIELFYPDMRILKKQEYKEVSTINLIKRCRYKA